MIYLEYNLWRYGVNFFDEVMPEDREEGNWFEVSINYSGGVICWKPLLTLTTG